MANPIQILPQAKPWSQTIADALGTLAQQKLTGQGLQTLGFTPTQSQNLQYLPGNILQEVASKKINELTPQDYAILQNLYGLQSSAQMPQQEGEQLFGANISSPAFAKAAQMAERKKEFQQAQKIKQQAQIDKTNAPYLKKLSERETFAEDINKIASQMIDLLNTGKVESGLFGHAKSFGPTSILNPESQQFDALSKELANYLASRSGIATNFKIKLAQQTKPMLGHSPETQRKLLSDALSKVQPILKEAQLRDQLIEQNEGQQPANLETLIKRQLKGEPITKEKEQPKEIELKAGEEYDSLKDVEDLPDGSEVEINNQILVRDRSSQSGWKKKSGKQERKSILKANGPEVTQILDQLIRGER